MPRAMPLGVRHAAGRRRRAGPCRRAARSGAASPPSRPRPGRPRSRRSDSARPSRPRGRPSRPSRACGLRAPGRTGRLAVGAGPGSTSSVVAGSSAMATSIARPVAGPLDRPQDDLDGGLVRGQRRREAALVALPRRQALVVEDRPERVRRSRRRRAAPRRTCPAPTGMTMNSWKSVESWACLPPLRMLNIGTGRVRAPDTAEVAVQRQVVRGGRRVGAGERHAEDGVGAQRALVGRPVERR